MSLVAYVRLEDGTEIPAGGPGSLTYFAGSIRVLFHPVEIPARAVVVATRIVFDPPGRPEDRWTKIIRQTPEHYDTPGTYICVLDIDLRIDP